MLKDLQAGYAVQNFISDKEMDHYVISQMMPRNRDFPHYPAMYGTMMVIRILKPNENSSVWQWRLPLQLTISRHQGCLLLPLQCHSQSQVYYSTRQVCVAAYDDDLEWDSSETGLDSSVYEGICRPPYRRKNWRLVRMGLVPEKWKPLQQKLYMTKEERKKEFFDHIAKLAKKKSLAVRAVSGFVVPDAVIHHIFPDNHASSDSETDEEQLTTEEKALLAASKPDFSKATSAKWLPLHTAVASGQAMHVADLLKNGYDINALDKDGLTALHRAIMAGRSAISKQLIDAGADISVRDSDNATVLHYAVTANCIEVVKILLWECKVDVNASDVDGWTPLHIAVQGQMLKVTGVLINYGADRTLKNKDGNLPLDIALSFGESFGMYEVVTALKATNVVVKRCIKKHPAAKDLYYNSDS